MVALTVTTGAVDATCFLHLGRVFGSVVTGNLVLLGVAATRTSGELAVSAGVAIGGYAAGVLAGAPIARERDRAGDQGLGAWPGRVTACLAAELAVLAALCAGWDAAGGHPDRPAALLLLGLASGAMGMQGAAVRRLGQLSTTYLTGMLTGVLAALAGAERSEGLIRSVGVLAAIVAGAAAGAAASSLAPLLLPLVVMLPAGLVTVTAASRWPAVRPAAAGQEMAGHRVAGRERLRGGR